MKIIIRFSYLLLFISISTTPVSAQNSTTDLDSILQKIEQLWTTKHSCDSIEMYVAEVYDANGLLAQLEKSLSTYEFQENLIPFEQKIISLIELHNDCPVAGGSAWKCKSRYPKWNWNYKLRWKLKYLLYSIDYIGLTDQEQFDKVISKIPFLLKNKRFGAIQLNFERDLLNSLVKNVPMDHLIATIQGKAASSYRLIFNAIKHSKTEEEYQFFINKLNKKTR